MKKVLIMAALVVATMSIASAQETVGQKAKETTRQAGKTMDAAGHKVGREARKAGNTIKSDAQVVGAKAKESTKKGMDKMDHGMKKAENKMNNN